MRNKKSNKGYKSQKVQPAKTIMHSIPNATELVAGHKFAEIIAILGKQNELGKKDRYLYGYSLLQTRQLLQALIILWPAAKVIPDLQADCSLIAQVVFSNHDLGLAAEELSVKDLHILFLVATDLYPKSKAYSLIKKRLFERMWQDGAYDKLEQVIKSSQDRMSGTTVENLGKLTFPQAEKKLVGNMAAFVSLVLTGGTGLILRSSLYHKDADLVVQTLAGEIKQLYSQLDNHSLIPWSRESFAGFVDYEADTLIKTLGYLIQDKPPYFEIAPTPGYLAHYDKDGKIIGTQFLNWLAQKNQDLAKMYDPEFRRAILWVIGAEKIQSKHNLMQVISQNKFPVYLKLALMLRMMEAKKSNSKGLVNLSDFKESQEPTDLFKDIALKSINSMLYPAIARGLQSEFGSTLLEFYPVLASSELKSAILMQAINEIGEPHDDELSFASLLGIAELVEETLLVKQLDILSKRKKECAEFLLTIFNEKKVKKLIESITTQAQLLAHLTLLADICLFNLPDDLPEEFFEYVGKLVNHKAINRIIQLKDLFECDFQCGCFDCQDQLYEADLPNLAAHLRLPKAELPKASDYSNKSIFTETTSIKGLLLQKTDPFEILGVDLDDSKPIIMQKLMELMKSSPTQMGVYRQAQNELFNPGLRFIHHYLRYLAFPSEGYNTEEAIMIQPESAIDLIRKIPFRQELINAN